METRTEHHVFDSLPLKVSGGTVIARVSGDVMWKLREDGTLLLIRDLNLKGEDGSTVEVVSSDEIFTVVYDALLDKAKSHKSRTLRGDDMPMSSTPYDPKAPGDLDNAQAEGAPSAP
jgi:hypothetical protein